MFRCDSESVNKGMQRLRTAPLGGARTCLSEASPAAQFEELRFLLTRSVQRALLILLSGEKKYNLIKESRLLILNAQLTIHGGKDTLHLTQREHSS